MNDGAPTDETESAARDLVHETRRRGRGTRSNRVGRYERETRETFDDGWEGIAELAPFATVVREETARSVIARNDSPDISFDRSINPYRGCEHGCVYCYARPTHCYLGHSAGLDFETQLYAKVNAPEALERELAARSYSPQTIALGTVTDPYQPIERTHGLTRRVLEVLERTGHPVGIVTKSALIVRDLDILARMAARGLVKVALSITTLDARLARKMEPRATTPAKRLDALRQLSAAGVPTCAMVAPIIPGLNDHEIERILEAAKAAGATRAGYVLLRLPLEIKELFEEWLATEAPDRARRVMHLMQSAHEGRAYRSEYGVRQVGSGPYAAQIAQRFALAIRRLGLDDRKNIALRTDQFVRPGADAGQLDLF